MTDIYTRANMKYKNTKIKTEDGVFDSKAEYRRWIELRGLELAGEIQGLQRQVEYELIPRQYIGTKLVERAVKYKADFVYLYKGEKVVEDVKSSYTRKLHDYTLKRKLMLYLYGIKISEVTY